MYHHLKGNLKAFQLNQISRLYTEHIQSFGCLHDKVYIISLKVDRSYLRGE